MLLRARIVLPVSQQPIENGAVIISGDRIQKVGTWKELSESFTGKKIDLGESVLLPGLINAHCHLDYTDMAGLISAPKHFPDWIKAILALKADWSYSEYATSWLNGARMLLRTGTTTVADIEAVPELLPEVWHATPLRLLSFLEMTGVKSKREPSAIVQEALSIIAALPAGRNFAGLSPHSLYSTTPELIQRSVAAARKKNLLVTTHVAESKEEFEMFTHQRGPLFNWLKKQRDMSDCMGPSPVQQLESLQALRSNFLAVHVNYLKDGDARLLAKNHSSVVHCPRSHTYFRHDPFPLKKLTEEGVNVCLGTDSLASVKKERGQKCELSMFSEMRTFANNFIEVSPDTVLQMATINGAVALGLHKQVGVIEKNFAADLITVPFKGRTEDASDAVVHFRGDVTSSMIGGQWAIPTVI